MDGNTQTGQAPTGSDDPTKTTGTTTPDPTKDPDGSTPASDEDGTTQTKTTTETDADPSATLLKIQAENKRLQAQLEAEIAKKEKAVEESQARRDKLRGLRDKHGDTEGELEELRADIQTKDDQIGDLKTKLAAAEAEVKTFRESQEARRIELLAKIPEADRAEFDDPAVFGPSRLEKIVATYTQPAAARTPDAETPAGAGSTSAPTTLGDAIKAEYQAKGLELK